MTEHFFEKMVIELSKESKCVSKQVGAIIVKEGRIISTGYNGTISGYKNCCEVFDKNNFNREDHHKWSKNYEIHAEQNALMMAVKYGISVNNCICYSSLQPCNTCLLLLIQAGIKEIVYKYDYDKCEYDQDLLDFIKLKDIKIRKFENGI